MGGTLKFRFGMVMVYRESHHDPLLPSWNDMHIFWDGDLGLVLVH